MFVARSVATLRAGRVLMALAGEREADLPIAESTWMLDGHEVRRFAPLGPSRREVVLLHGLTSRGASDVRLVRLARRLASEGVGCSVPHLAGLARFEEDSQDLELASECVRRACRAFDGLVSLVGFSLGGGYALVLAGHAALSPHVSYVLAVGAHHDLAQVWREGDQLIEVLPSRLEQATESELYAALACAAQRLEPGMLSLQGRDELARLLQAFCQSVDSAHVRQFVQTHLLPLWPRIASPRCWPSSASLSPAGRLENISAAVTLLHSSDDVLVPADHAARNYAELCQRRSGKQSILCTPLLEHVAPRWSQSWRDVPALVSAFADLL